MPHMFANRIRLYDLTKDKANLQAQFRWETFNAALYKLGGLVFIAGSILFFPRFEAYQDIGAWIFFAGSLLYLVVTVHDLIEVWRHWHQSRNHGIFDVFEWLAASSYLWGTILFTVGSIFFLSRVGLPKAGAWCFVVGSLLFVLGACINVLRIVSSKNLVTLQLMNLTAVSFVIGSVLFTVASIPYLWNFNAAYDKEILFSFLAWQYLVGSTFFLLGGIFNYWRAYVLMRQAMRQRGDAAATGWAKGVRTRQRPEEV
ncbi:MAG: YrhK family protein [Desulfovibrio sp.]